MIQQASHQYFEKVKNQLFPIAYNITGSVQDSEDIIQDIFISWNAIPKDSIQHPLGYLKRSTANASLNFIRKNRKEVYPGTWLPEPISDEVMTSIYSQVDQKNILSYALLVILEKLNPKERVVFILKEAFDYAHKEIAEILEITTESSRQLLKRAKDKLKQHREREAEINFQSSEAMLDEFMEAFAEKSLEKLKKLLHHEVKITTDGGGKVSCARNIISGVNHTSRFFVGIYQKSLHQFSAKKISINQHPAIVFYNQQGIRACYIPKVHQNQIIDNYIVMNPDKLKHLLKLKES